METEDWHPLYPTEDGSILAHFNGRYDAALVVLHPFILITEGPADAYANYPPDEVIASRGMPLRWSSVCERAPFSSVKELNLALLTRIGALKREFSALVEANRLTEYLKSPSIWPPGEGQIQPLILGTLLTLLDQLGYRSFVARDEFAEHRTEVVIPTQEIDRRIALNSLGFVVTRVSSPDDSVLAIVHWDSFFTILLGSEPTIEAAEKIGAFEGFRCSPETTHLWWFSEPSA